MFDIILVFFFLLMVYLGWKRGFVKAFMRFFGFFISSAIAYLSYKPVSEWLMTTPLAERVNNFIKNDVIHSNQHQTLLNVPLPGEMKMAMEKTINSGINSAVNGTAEALTTLFVSIISMVLVFVLALIAIRILEHMLNGVVKLPGLSFFNKVCGFIIGVINGAICVYVIILLTTALVPFTPWLADMSQKSIITNLIF